MSSYNNMNQFNMNNANGLQNGQQKSFFSKILRDLSNWGTDYDDMLQRNKVSVSLNEDPTLTQSNDMYGYFSQRAISSLLERKSIAALDKAYPEKKRILREYSIKNNIREYIEIVCNEAIIYEDDTSFATILPLPSTNYSKVVQDSYLKAYEKIYHAYGFNDGRYAWDMFRDFIVDGTLALEIIYDDKDLNIIGFSRIDPYSITPSIDITTGKQVWIQFIDDPSIRRIIIDSKIIYISYKSQSEYSETSYVEPMIKPFNQYELLLKTRLMYNIINASINQVFKIPIGGLSRQKAEEEISKLISNYSEYIQFDDVTGHVIINGSKNLQLNKQIWLPTGESGTPEVDFLKPEGHDINESEVLSWFYNELKRSSRIPASRFESEGGGGSMYTDLNEMTRDEIKFGLFIKRLRASFKEILIKPLRLQMLIEFPQLRGDIRFYNDIKVIFASNDLFEEWRKDNNFKKRLESANSALDFKISENESYFDNEFIVEEILKLSAEQIAKNKAYKIKNKGLYQNTGDGGGLGDDFGSSGGGGGDFGGGDFGGDTDFGGTPAEPTDDGGGGTDEATTDTDTGNEDFEI